MTLHCKRSLHWLLFLCIRVLVFLVYSLKFVSFLYMLPLIGEIKMYIKFSGSGLWGLKIVGPKYQKLHPYAKSVRINRFSYTPVEVFKRYTTPRKK